MGSSPSASAPPDRVGYLHVYTQNIGMESPEEFIGMLASGDFDLVFLQEAYIAHQKGWEVLANQLGYHLHFQILRRDAGMGGLIMSKYPMQALPSIRTRSWARHIRYFPRVRIKWEQVPIDLYTIHLESLPLVQGGRMLFGSAKIRLRQAEILAREIERTNYPVILAGDLNSTPIYRSNRPLRDTCSTTPGSKRDGALATPTTPRCPSPASTTCSTAVSAPSPPKSSKSPIATTAVCTWYWHPPAKYCATTAKTLFRVSASFCFL
ncbi:MAG: endonuclease/exonuclease/phosphatase family protein, partial [Candidatus Latescibacterota bacterium]|nr:endonuclease/exonuclease/phosphatase family protein [Candidatus Latescibacterota bacterium]